MHCCLKIPKRKRKHRTTAVLKFFIPIFTILLAVSCSCNKGEKSDEEADSTAFTGSSLKVPVKEVLMGTIGVCSSSDNLELIKPDSGIVNIIIGNERFFGSTDLGDSVEVTLLMIDGHPVSSTIVNLNSLLHTWMHHDDSLNVNTFLSIQDSHYAHLFNNIGMDNNCNWHLDDGRLILTTPSDSSNLTQNDTLHIVSMTNDSLVVYDGKEELAFVCK